MKVAAVIPCFRVKRHILGVIARIGPECQRIYVVDDACPEGSGDLVETQCHDPRVRVLRHEQNQGVGGATVTGYRAALADGADVIVRLDGDGQMDPALIPTLIQPIADGEADYAKGNRFFEPEGVRPMPWIRLIGNTFLSFASKLSSGYWNIFDPTNGFTAIHTSIARTLPLAKLSRGWFFESDMLFRLGIIRAVVCDVPMHSVYEDEQSSLKVRKVIGEFAVKHVANTVKRIFYTYYLRDFNFASMQLALGLPLLAFGVVFGIMRWIEGVQADVPATSGTVMLAALPVIVGVQFVLAFLGYDLQNIPRDVLHRRLRPIRRQDQPPLM